MTKTFKKTLLNRDGAALVEYGILVGLVSVLAISAVLALGIEVKDTFTNVSDALDESMTEIADTGPTGPSTPAPGDENPEWTEIADYPTGGSCFDVNPDGTYDSGYSCYNIDAGNGSVEPLNNFRSEPGNLTFRVFGTGTGSNSGDDSLLDVGHGGSATIVTASSPTWFWHMPGDGNDYILFPNRNCSDLTSSTADAIGRLSLDFADGMRVITESDLEGVYCAGDNVTLTSAELNPNGYEASRFSMGGFPGGF